MNARIFAMTVSAVVGLLFIGGAGCSDKDKNAQLHAAALKARLDLKEKELACRVEANAKTCATGDTACNDARATKLAECDKLAAEADKVPFGVTVTNTGTGTSTSTSTSTSVDAQ